MDRQLNHLCVGLIFAGALAVASFISSKEAEARRGFGAMFSAGRIAGSAAKSTGRVSRSAEEIAQIKHTESKIDWVDASKNGLDVVKTAIEQVGNASSSPSNAFSSSTLGIIELEACVRESRWLDQTGDAFDAKQISLKHEEAKINRLGDEIDRARTSVDRYSQHSVDAFNNRIEEHRRLVALYNNVLLVDARRNQDSFNRRVSKFNAYCNGKRYYADDLAEVEQKVGFKVTN